MFARKQSDLSWEVATDDETWVQLTGPHSRRMIHTQADAATTGRRLHLLRLLGFTLSAVLFGTLLGSYWYRQASSGLAQVESELQAPVGIETWAAQSRSEVVLNERLDPATSELWRTPVQLTNIQVNATQSDVVQPPKVRPILFRDGIALVEMRNRSGDGAVYVAKRFYRETEDGWVRTSSRPTLWGPLRVRESRFFRFYFGARDEETVDTVAASIDGAYAAMRADLGLPEADSSNKLSVHVTVSETPEFDLLNLRFEDDNLDIPSPELLSVRQDVKPDKALQLGILQALALKLYYDSEKQFPVRRPWHLLRQTIPGWQVSRATMGEHRSTTMLRWLYSDWPAIRRGERSLSPQEVDWICDISSTGVPIVENPLLADDCGGETPAQLIAKMPMPPASLRAVNLEPGIGYEREHWLQERQRRAILTSIVSYGVEKYGRDSLPLLIEATTTYDDWSTLIPAVYGITLEEFEAGWLAYLAPLTEAPDL